MLLIQLVYLNLNGTTTKTMNTKKTEAVLTKLHLSHMFQREGNIC